jgi:hypothetical protein
MKLLEWEKVNLRMKSRAIWFIEGDEIIKFFQELYKAQKKHQYHLGDENERWNKSWKILGDFRARGNAFSEDIPRTLRGRY